MFFMPLRGQPSMLSHGLSSVLVFIEEEGPHEVGIGGTELERGACKGHAVAWKSGTVRCMKE